MSDKHTPGAVRAADAVEKLIDEAGYLQTSFSNSLHQCVVAAIDRETNSTELMEELEAIVRGWDSREADAKRGMFGLQPLTEWEIERRNFARAAIAKARGKA